MSEVSIPDLPLYDIVLLKITEFLTFLSWRPFFLALEISLFYISTPLAFFTKTELIPPAITLSVIIVLSDESTITP